MVEPEQRVSAHSGQHWDNNLLLQHQQTSEFANAALTYSPQVQMKSRCNVFELSLHKMKTLKHGRDIKLKIKCKA